MITIKFIYRCIVAVISTQNIKMLHLIYVSQKITFNPLILLVISLFCYALEIGHTKLQNFLLKRIRTQPVADYLQAHRCYYFGQYSRTIYYLQRFLKHHPLHVDSHYLLNKAKNRLGDTGAALDGLYSILNFSKRKKTWILLSRMVDTHERFMTFKTRVEPLLKKKPLSFFYLSNLSEAGLKVGAYAEIKTMWQETLPYLNEANFSSIKTSSKKQMNCGRGEVALIDLKKCLDADQIKFFLISGTLLGCIRQSTILPHDKDLDIGVFDLYTKEDLSKILIDKGCFELVDTKSDKQIKVKHCNGTVIDIFIHYTDNGDYVHQTSKMRWRNKIFDLREYSFLNHMFLIPANYDLYLTENYGPLWRIPQLDFDSTIDTPNGELINQDEAYIYFCKKAVESHLFGNVDKKRRYQELIMKDY